MRQGGHNVPDEDVIRRFNRGLVKFWQIYRMQSDYYSIVFNNEYYDFKRIAHGKPDSIEIVDEDLYQEFLSQVKERTNEV